MDGSGNLRSLWTILGFLGAIGLGFGGTHLVQGRLDLSSRGADLRDGVVVFGLVKDDGGLAIEWGDLRVSPSQRTFALVGGDLKGRPQLLVFPMESAWPALAVPVGWKVAWVSAGGQVLEVQVACGIPLQAKDARRVRKARFLFALPPHGEAFHSLAEGVWMTWSFPVAGTGARG
jgi:hypothetical protein